MKTPKPILGIFALAAVLLMVCGITAKGVTSEIYVTGELNWNIGADPGMSGSFSVPQFNPAVGVLDAVEVNAECTYSSTVTVSGPADASGTIQAVGSVIVQDPGNNIYLSGNTLCGAWEGNFSLPSYASCSGWDVGYNLSPLTYDSAAVLSEFTGDGNLNFQVTGSQSAYAIGPGTVDINSANLTTIADVTYVYSVPEPSCFSLLVVGFGIMLTARKAARKQRARSSF